MKIIRRFFRLAFWFGILSIALVVLALFISAFSSHYRFSLKPWHTTVLTEEYFAGKFAGEASVKNYLLLEEKLFTELSSSQIENKDQENVSPYLRFLKGGKNNPTSFETNWNRTQELIPSGKRKGSVLLIHGLSDSPYSMRSLAEHFYNNNYYVLCLRLPGHGTLPANLLNTSWKDWESIVSIAFRDVAKESGPDGKFIVGGYSSGGALALNYVTKTQLGKEQDGVIPDVLLFFSPAVGVSPLARVSNWHKLFSWIPFFAKDQWLEIVPEIDPFKYNSFPKNAGAQIYELSKRVQSNIAKLVSEDKLLKLPPTLTFQSIADSTILGKDTIEHLYLNLKGENYKIVIFDTNNLNSLHGMLSDWPRASIEKLMHDKRLHFTLTLVTNKNENSSQVKTSTRYPGKDDLVQSNLDLSWPQAVFSLSHISIPFPTNDPLYGEGPAIVNGRLRPGGLAARGELYILLLSPSYLLRLRYNPFHSFMLESIDEFLENIND